MSYWTFSDVFEEQGVVKTPFYGGYGLIAERSIPKASFRAFELLHQLGEKRIDSPQEALITERSDGALVIALWNYAEPGEVVAARHVLLKIQGKHGRAKSFTVQYVDPQHGSALAAWKAMGSPATPSKAQIEELRAASQMEPPKKLPVNEPIELPAQRLSLVIIQ
jgi:xylan 1,4-beta-xylosidase